jgi:uncharacterized membrane protein
MLYLMFIMLYAYPPALIAHFVGYEVLQSPTGAMISYPGTVIAWIVIVCFYLLVALLINRVFGVRFAVK